MQNIHIARINILSLIIFSMQTVAAAWQQDSLSTHKPRKMQQQKSLSFTITQPPTAFKIQTWTPYYLEAVTTVCVHENRLTHIFNIFFSRILHYIDMLQANISCILVDSAYYIHWLHIYINTLSLWKRMRSGCEHMCEIVIMLCRCQMEVQHRLTCTTCIIIMLSMLKWKCCRIFLKYTITKCTLRKMTLMYKNKF